MKSLIISLALFILFKPFVPVAVYVVNYDYISKVLCINRDRPKMHCNGKCFLKKQMAMASDNGGATESKLLLSIEYTCVYFQKTDVFLVGPEGLSGSKEKAIDNYRDLYSHIMLSSVFHPPTFMAS